MAMQAKQTIQQRLMMAPNVALALEVLRMPTLELRAFLEHQLEENPLLELDEVEQDEESPTTPENGQNDEIADRLPQDEDWTAHWRTASERENQENDDEFPDASERRPMAAPSLHESLQLQLGCQSLNPEQRRLGEIIIQRISEHGYLDGSLEDIAAECGVAISELEAVLRVIQQLDPPGVGARNLRECLLLQVQYHRTGARETRADLPELRHIELAWRILQDHFRLFLDRRTAAIAKATHAFAEDVSRACAYLQQLNPKPGGVFSGDLSPSIVPDLIIRHREYHYDVELNDQEVPHLTVSRAYYRMLRDPRTPSDAKEFLTMKFRRASWLIKAIDERNTTLLSIARCLISLQGEFLDQGPKAIKPLTQAQVASVIGRHPSTVSRAIAGKTIDTPYGIFRLEQLFATSVPQPTQPEAISDERIKAELQRLIEEEEPAHPFSDAALAQQLAQRQMTVARRTIAKYRSILRILPAHLRKHHRY